MQHFINFAPEIINNDMEKKYTDHSDWTNWPTDGQTYGGNLVKVTNDASFNDKTWTLTPKN